MKSIFTSHMKLNLIIFAITMSLLTAISGMAYALPAFPGAEGFGSTTKGGRGGRVIMVTNLNDSGPGSLRAAVEASGPRIVVFRTGGTISLSKNLVIDNPYITIAGQTAPGDGITLRDAKVPIITHDVILRGIRFRPGPKSSLDALEVAGKGETYNVIIDHCSMSWAIDENLSAWYNPKDITYSWNIISEGLNSNGGHGLGMLIGGYPEGDERLAANNISVHHNLFAHNRDRNARIKQNTKVEFINNLVYNWNAFGTRTSSAINIIANHYKTGPGWKSSPAVAIRNYPTLQDNSIYLRDNIGPGRLSNSGSEWNIIKADSRYQAANPIFPLSNVNIDPVENIHDKILASVGVIAPTRDSVDKRIINDVKKGTGTWNIGLPSDVGGWPNLTKGTPQQDSDSDGMPDQWETMVGLNKNNAADSNLDRNGDGYTNIEEYINSLIPGDSPPTVAKVNPPTNVQIVN